MVGRIMRTIIVLAALWLLVTLTTLVFDVLFANEIIGAITFTVFVVAGYSLLVKLLK